MLNVCFHRISELMERETLEFYKSDPDPFDDRHPGSLPPSLCFHAVSSQLEPLGSDGLLVLIGGARRS